MSGRRFLVRAAVVIATGGLALSLTVGSAYAAPCDATWTDGNGNWSGASNWSTNSVPNSSSTNVCITDGTSAVTLDQSTGVANLTLATGNVLNTDLNITLAVGGPSLSNAGAITVNGGSGTNSILELSGNVTLSGGGTVTLNSGDTNGLAYIMQGSGPLTLTNSDNTIQGYGIIGNGGLALGNQGTVNANVASNTLTLNGGGGVTNTGQLEATNGGTLLIQSNVANNGGTITANGGAVHVNATISGGTLTTTGSSVMQTTNGSATLDGSTNAVTISAGSTYTASNGNTTGLLGTITNNGTIDLNGGQGSNGLLQMQGDVTLNGGGTLTLNSGDNNGHAIILEALNGLTLTNSNNLIQGYGIIGNGGGLALNNQGTVNANSLSNTLTLNGTGGVTNTGLLEATAGGTLLLQSVVSNAGGNITADGGTVNVNTTISGGTLNTANSGTMQTSNGGATLTGVTISSGSTYTASNNNTTVLNGAITNNGTINLNGGQGFNGTLDLGSNVTLSGGGTVTLSSGDNNGQAIIQQGLSGLILTNSDNTIQGYGVIGNGGLALDNQATVNANSAFNTLTLNGSGGVTNASQLEATNGGTLLIESNVANNGGTITANGGSVNVNATISGGTLTTTGSSVMQTANGSATLDGSTNAVTISAGSTYTASKGNTTNLLGTITNNGTIDLNAGQANNGVLQIQDNVTLNGGGTLTLNSGDNNGQAIIQQASGGLTLTNSNNLIQGYGVIGNGGLTLNNQGTVNANSLSNTLTLNGSGGVTNTGLLEATGGGTLLLQTGVSNAGGNITADGGTVNVNTTISGGTLNTTNSGVMQTTNGGATLDGSTNAVTISAGSTYTASNGNTTGLLGTITNNGTINLNGGNGPNGFLQLGSNVTLNGGGTLTLNSGDNNGQAIIQQASSGLTLTNSNNLIQGYGVIGNGGLALNNQGTVNANSLSNTLILNGSGGVTNTSLLEATAGGKLLLQSVVSNAGGNITADGGTVNVNTTISGGTLNTTNSGVMQTTNGGATLTGVTISSGSTYTATNNSTTILNGAIANNGTIDLNGGQGGNGFLQLDSNVTLSGGGTVTLNSGDTNGFANITQGSAGLVLTNGDNLIQGYGVIGDGGLTLDNRGTVSANVSGRTLLVNGTGGADNSGGTMEAGNGGTLSVTSGLTSTTFSGGVLNGHYSVDGTGGVSTLQLSALGTGGGEVTQIGDGTTSSSVTLSGTNANTKLVDGGGSDALALARVSSNGKLTVQQAYVLQAPGDVANNGTVMIGGGGAPASLIVGPSGANTYSQAGSTSLTQVNGTLQASNVNISAGLLNGIGTVDGAVSNTGGSAEGGAGTPGALSITGDYTQGASAALLAALGGTGAGQYSQLLVTRTASLQGTLALDLVNGFHFTNNQTDTFDLLGTGNGLTNGMTALSLNGTSCGSTGVDQWTCNFGSFFDVFTEITLSPGSLVAGDAPQDLELTVVQTATGSSTPEPGSLALLGTGIVALAARVRRRRTLAAKHPQRAA